MLLAFVGDDLFAVTFTVGAVLSIVMLTVFDAVFPFPAPSVHAFAFTFTL